MLTHSVLPVVTAFIGGAAGYLIGRNLRRRHR